MNHKMSRELPVGMHVQLYSRNMLCVPLFLARVTLKSCTCSTGATGKGSPAAGWAAGLAATCAAGWLHSWLRVWHQVWQLWEQASQGAWLADVFPCWAARETSPGSPPNGEPLAG